MVKWGPDVPLAALAAKMADCPRGFGECKAAGVYDSGGELAAVVVFHNWNPEAGVIEVSAGAINPKWATRTVLRDLFGYAFGFCQMVVARTHEDNTRVRRLWKAFGADEHILPRMRGRTASEAAYLLSDDAWSSSRFMR